MLIFLVSCFSFIFVLKSISLKPILQRLSVLEILSPMVWFELSDNLAYCTEKIRLALRIAFGVPLILVPEFPQSSGEDSICSSGEKEEGCSSGISLLDLPELALDSILGRLSPAELCSLASVCSYLREKCRSDHLWQRHLKGKWGRVIGKTAFREWQSYVSSNKRRPPYVLKGSGFKGLLDYISSFFPTVLGSPELEDRSKNNGGYLDFDTSVMAWYSSLQSGKYWFPAQVYNRENGHGFMLSCYDAELSYNPTTDTFQARYSPRGRRAVEENISWNRLRIPPVDTPPFVLHVSDCLDDLKPGDHFEIQWRRNGDYPYGWWYGVVGHLDLCHGNYENPCECHKSDIVVLEFNHYPPESRWRKAKISRVSHREDGNEADGFYGGVRKLYDKQEISMWKSIWPKSMLEH